MKNDFTNARLKLIVLYLLIIGSVITLFSLLILYQANDSFSDPAVKTEDSITLEKSEALAIAQAEHPQEFVTETEYEIEDNQLYFTTSFGEELEVKVNLITGEILRPQEKQSLITAFTDDFDEMVIWIALLIFLLAALLCVYVAHSTLFPIAESIKREKQFVSNAAHELRNPLAAIHARIESSLRVNKETHSREVLEDLLSETKHLIGISENLLSLERSERLKMPTSSQPLKKSVDRILNRLELVALEKDITLSSSIDAVRVLIGVAELETVLYNLIHNAIKFTPRGGKITVKNNAKILTVEDTGIGIDQKHIPVLFDRFYKADASRTYQGSGLGLSLVKEILDTSNATITVRSELTKGTVFTVVFK